VRGRKTFGKSSRRGAHEPSTGENGERPCAFSNEVRRRIEARVESNASARKQGDVGRIDIPGDGFGRISRLLVFGKEAEELA